MTKTSKINSIRKSPRLLKKTKKKSCLSGPVKRKTQLKDFHLLP